MHDEIPVGAPVTLEALFLDEDGEPVDPSTITLTITPPTGAVVTRNKAQLTDEPDVGRWSYQQTADEAGLWTYHFEATGGTAAEASSWFLAGRSAHPGPCEDWCGPEDPFTCSPAIAEDDRDYGLAARMVTVASELLYMASGRLYPGWCELSARPCGLWACGHTEAPWGTCGCGRVDELLLPGPVIGVLEVRVDGAVVDPATWRLDGRRLVRLDGDRWPTCQDLAADPETDSDTFLVTYVRGRRPPEAGRHAAALLARELYNGCAGADCKLPEKTVTVVRQGTTLSLTRPETLGLDRDGKWTFGIREVDYFLGAYGRPAGRRRAGSAHSPHAQPATRRTG